jgi:tetratricopeptide (TPR) repeat protein
VSQSPLDSQNLNSLQSYRQGWKALNRLLHENKSFSGRETNNAFLNCGDGGAFADVSTAIGWDFADDARAIGLIDYDQDGDLDLFVSNRTAPRVRLLKNNLQSDSSFLSLHLTGTAKTTPRDAIGARVAVHLKDQAIPHLRTLHAGQSFLSQSSRWLHFGLGKNATIEKIIVHWPGSAPQTFTDLQPDQFLHLTQDSDKATPRKKAPTHSLTPSDQQPAPPTDLARIIPPAGNAVPDLPTADRKLLSFKNTTLISLWSHTCPHCQKELTEWAKEFQKWKSSGLDLILFSTDQEPRTQSDTFLKSIGSPFPAEMASPNAVELLDALQASIVDLWTPIPVPSSFLVSADGELLAIYRGPVSPDQVIADAKLEKATSRERRTAGTPFTGRWVGDPAPATPQRTTDQLVQRDLPDLAISYLGSALSKPFLKGTKFNHADNLLLLGQLLGQNGRPAEAIAPLREARKLLPQDIRIVRLLAAGLSETKQLPEALVTLHDTIQEHPENADLREDASRLALENRDPKLALIHLAKTVFLKPTDPVLRYRLILLQLEQGQPAQAIANCKTILGTSPKFLDAANLLSRILSTHPQEKIRSPQEALALASRLNQFSKNRNANHLLTLAYAQANLSQYKAATTTLNQLTKVAPPDSPFTKEVKAALQKTKSNHPIRNPTWQ